MNDNLAYKFTPKPCYSPSLTAKWYFDMYSRLCKSIFPMDSEYDVIPPTVKKETKAFYKHVVTIGKQGVKSISRANKAAYEAYVSLLRQ